MRVKRVAALAGSRKGGGGGGWGARFHSEANAAGQRALEAGGGSRPAVDEDLAQGKCQSCQHTTGGSETVLRLPMIVPWLSLPLREGAPQPPRGHALPLASATLEQRPLRLPSSISRSPPNA